MKHCLLAVMFLLAAAVASAAEVANIQSRLEGNQVIITYDLAGAAEGPVAVRGSDDGGTTYQLNMAHVSGDVGESVAPGSDRRVVWDVLRDYPRGLGSKSVVFEVTASGGRLKAGAVGFQGDHSAYFAKLPADYYMPYRTENYAACFECHDTGIALTENSKEITEFRNGDLNMHFLHVNKDPKGRSCKACHTTESESHQEKMMRDEVPFGKSWKLPVAYTKTATGGRCVVGCHKPKDYDRTNPVRY